MSNGAKIANAVAATPRRRRGFNVRALVILTMTWSGAPGTVGADAILLQSGELIEGIVVDATRNTVVIRRAIGGMRQMRLRDIDEVRIDLGEGKSVSGGFLSWADDVYLIRVGDEVIRIRAGLILSRAPYEEADRQLRPALPPRRQEERTVETKAAPAGFPPEATARNSAAGNTAAESPGTKGPAVENTISRSPAAASTDTGNTTPQGAASLKSGAGHQAKHATEPVAVKGSVDPVGAGATELVFRIELARPAEQTVVLIYGTVDGTAKAGQHYEPQQGIVTLAPGSQSADVRVPLIEQRPRRDDSRFELFLTSDPKVAKIVDQRVIATIPGDG
jgi:Calx-beta domain